MALTCEKCERPGMDCICHVRRDVYVVVSQTLGSQYVLHGVYSSMGDALDAIDACIKGQEGWTTDHCAVDSGLNEMGRWVHPELRLMYTIHEEEVND